MNNHIVRIDNLRLEFNVLADNRMFTEDVKKFKLNTNFRLILDIKVHFKGLFIR